MNKSRILSVALTAAMVASVAAVSTIGASAATLTTADQINDGTHTVGIVGGFNGWAADGEVAMTDDDGDGVYEGTISVPEVKADMLTDGKVEFKVRLDASWDNSWGDYDTKHTDDTSDDDDRTENSQTNCAVAATEGQPLTVNVKFDTTAANPEALANSESGANDPEQLLYFLNVSYEVVDTAADDTTADDTTADDTTADDTTADEESDTAPVQTGDATSAVALAAVVVASLGTAVVMTKKASAKN